MFGINDSPYEHSLPIPKRYQSVKKVVPKPEKPSWESNIYAKNEEVNNKSELIPYKPKNNAPSFQDKFKSFLSNK